MRRLKIILAAVVAVVAMMMPATPAIAQVVGYYDPYTGLTTYQNPDTGTYDPWAYNPYYYSSPWGSTPWTDNTWAYNPYYYWGDCDWVAGMCL
ncbi:MAG TPA: hypothetical protein VE288_09865 [Rubrobacteraceae bacterium]|jgi:hypothetical protein|nr:hypothetical protein [Rubrobacteraceae bacterium]